MEKKIRETFYKIVVVGVGGTGGLLANFLAKSLCDKNNVRLSLVDADIVEKKNLLRQPYTMDDIGCCKAEALAGALTDVYNMTVLGFNCFINNAEDIRNIFNNTATSDETEGKLIVNILCGCVDNHACRKAMHDYFSMADSNLLYIDSGNEFSYGEVVFGAKKGRTVLSPDKVFYFPDLFDGELKPRSEQSCEELNDAAPQHLCTNLMASNIMLSGILSFMNDGNYPAGIVHFDSGITGGFRLKKVAYAEGGETA